MGSKQMGWAIVSPKNGKPTWWFYDNIFEILKHFRWSWNIGKSWYIWENLKKNLDTLWKCLHDVGWILETPYISEDQFVNLDTSCKIIFCIFEILKHYGLGSLRSLKFRSSIFRKFNGWLFRDLDCWDFCNFEILKFRNFENWKLCNSDFWGADYL